MTFAIFAALNPGITEAALVADLEEMVDLGVGKEYEEALDDYNKNYAKKSIHKLNSYATFTAYGKKATEIARKNPTATILIIAAIVGIGIWYFKFYKK